MKSILPLLSLLAIGFAAPTSSGWGAININLDGSPGDPGNTGQTSLTYTTTTNVAQVGTNPEVPGMQVTLSVLTPGITLTADNDFAIVFEVDQATPTLNLSLSFPFQLDNSGGLFNADGTLTTANRFLRTGFRAEDHSAINTPGEGFEVTVTALLADTLLSVAPAGSVSNPDYSFADSVGTTEFTYTPDGNGMVDEGILRSNYDRLGLTGGIPNASFVELDEFNFSISMSGDSDIPAGSVFRITFDGGNFQPVPEPGQFLLLSTVAGGILFLQRRR